jgi:hypothetical protein
MMSYSHCLTRVVRAGNNGRGSEPLIDAETALWLIMRPVIEM